jgi:hypothetical protein
MATNQPYKMGVLYVETLAEETSAEDEETGMDNEHHDATLETDNSRQVWQRPRERSHEAEVWQYFANHGRVLGTRTRRRSIRFR